MAASLTLVGDLELYRTLHRLNLKVGKKAVRKAVSDTARKGLKVAKALVPVEHGVLKKSLASKVKVMKSGNVVGLIGPRRGFKTDKKTKIKSMTKFARRRVTASGRVIIQNPTKYSHLVEFGTKHSRKKPFIKPAEDVARKDLLSAIAKEVNEAAKNP